MKSWHNLSQLQLGQMLAVLIVLGYASLSVVNFSPSEIYFNIRGPLFSRLTAGKPRYLRAPGNSPSGTVTAEAFLKLDALLAFLLFTGRADVFGFTMASSEVVFAVQSEFFHFSVLQRILRNKKQRALDRLIMILLNLVLGVGLVKEVLAVTGTAYHLYGNDIGFTISGETLEPKTKKRPPPIGIAAIPEGGPIFRVFNRIVGISMLLNQQKVYAISISKGGSIVFTITGDFLQLKILPKLIV